MRCIQIRFKAGIPDIYKMLHTGINCQWIGSLHCTLFFLRVTEVKTQMREKLRHHSFRVNKELQPLRTIRNVAELCNPCKVACTRPHKRTQSLIRRCHKDVVGGKDTQVESVGKVIDIGIVFMKEVPIVRIVSPHRILHSRIRCFVGRDEYNNGLHSLICSKHVIDRLLLIPNHRILHQEDNTHLAICMCTVMKLLQIVRCHFTIGK